jgi:signal transduction histidine kinase
MRPNIAIDVDKRLEILSEQKQLVSDKNRLEAIVKNLISNAINYSDPYKETSYVELSASISDSEAIIKISDNGIGIVEENLPKIFDMFFRESSDGDGSGLGLFIVAEAVEKIGGKINVDSRHGEGTTFEIVIPNHLK